MHDFTKYKPNLKQYLQAKGFNTRNNPMNCFNPNHQNNDSPACLIYDENFQCKSCGIEGDVFDAAGILTGITDKAEQFKEVERVIKGFNPSELQKTEKKTFKPNLEAVKQFEKYVGTHKNRKEEAIKFLKYRGYSDDIIEKMWSKFGYWGGFEDCTISKSRLYEAGIPSKAWNHPGVVIKLYQGYKLLYYKDGKCEKLNSRGAKTFPAPKKELTGDIYITEAELSALSMLAIGYENVYSSGSVNGITRSNVNLLEKCNSITLLFDGDNAGRYHSGLDGEGTGQKTADKILNSNFKGKLYACNLPDGLDPDDIIREGKSLDKIIDNKIEIKKTVESPKEEVKIDNIPLLFLGYDGKKYYYGTVPTLAKNMKLNLTPYTIRKKLSESKKYKEHNKIIIRN